MGSATLGKGFQLVSCAQFSGWIIGVTYKQDFCLFQNFVRKGFDFFLGRVFDLSSHYPALHFVFSERGPRDEDFVSLLNHTFNEEPDDFCRAVSRDDILGGHSKPHEFGCGFPELQISVVRVFQNFSETIFYNLIKVQSTS